MIHAGDFVALSVLDELRALGPLAAVHGNVDDADVRAELPLEQVVEVEEARIAIVHVPGPRAGRASRLAARFRGCDAVVYGHTHQPEVARERGIWLLNPGSPTERRRAPAHTMLVVTVSGTRLRPRLVELT